MQPAVHGLALAGDGADSGGLTVDDAFNAIGAEYSDISDLPRALWQPESWTKPPSDAGQTLSESSPTEQLRKRRGGRPKYMDPVVARSS